MSRVIGIDVGGTKIAVGLSGGPGPEPAAKVRLPSGEDALARALAAARRLDGAPAAVGFSTCGVIKDGRVRLSPNVPGWDGLELPRLLREEYGAIPVAIDNDVNAAAAAELRWGALRGVSQGVYVNLGTGLAAALVIGGQVVPGAHGAAGEIGYLVDTPEEPAFAEGRAPLEERLSGSGLAARGSALLRREVTTADLFAQASAGERRPEGDLPEGAVREMMDEAVGALGVCVANLCVVLDPERVVIGGGMMRAADYLLPRVTAVVRRVVPFPPEIRPARFADDAPLMGALALGHAALCSGAR
ncbi:ROK family protein [Nonomuraea sp. NPDC046570]|uniref:ROK family protein n=1 Tax=Nonomuraea sp. NPDC046570 TaxID=3155255 RepID=UPI0033DF95B7